MQRAADQITLTDLTDGVSVTLSSESYVFPGTTDAAIAGSTKTKIQVLKGTKVIAPVVNTASITKPSGVTVTSDGNATTPTLTIAVSTSVKTAGEVVIPVVVGDLTIEKRFSYSIAIKGATGATGAPGDPGAPGKPAAAIGLLNEAQMIVADSAGKVVSTTTVVVDFYGYVGPDRANVTATVGTLPSGITVVTNTAGTTTADGKLSLRFAAGSTLGGTDQGTVTVSLSVAGVSRDAVFSWSKARRGADGSNGANGGDGAAAITLEVSSSKGLVFKNALVATVLTAQVFAGGVPVTGTALAALGTIRWFKDGALASIGSGSTLTISAGDVADRASYEARLEAWT